MVPLTPKLNPYRGSDLKQRRKAAEHNALAERVVAHLNKRIADDPDEDQSYNYGFVAKDLGLTAEQIRSAVAHGGHHGITIRVLPEDRKSLESYKSKPSK